MNLTTTNKSTPTKPTVSGPNETPASPVAGLLPLIVAGAAVTLSIGVYARVHPPTGQGIATFGFPAVLPMKAWFTTGAAALGLIQALSAAWMWGRLPAIGSPPSWLAAGHRWTGTAAFLLTLPVAYHCLWALGFQAGSSRVLIHSMLGCLFYGIFTTKMLCLRSDAVGPVTLPLIGGALVTTLTAIWFTSSLWFFTTIGFPGI